MTPTPRTTSWSGQRRSFPTAVRQLILRRAGGQCQHTDEHGTRCTNPATVADHIVPHAEGGTDDPTNGQALCDPHHNTKTRAEQARGRARRNPKRRTEPHPATLRDGGGTADASTPTT